jgi:hypothetical protein
LRPRIFVGDADDLAPTRRRTSPWARTSVEQERLQIGPLDDE